MYNQEYIVDEIIKKDLTKQYPELKKLIKTTSPHEIRGGIMSVLDKDRRVHRDIKFYENLNKECEYKTYTDEIVVNVRKYIEVADCEVKSHGEVMTPISLVEDMLNTLPDDVWTNKDLKWLDPCCGVGTFQSIIVQRLMKGLKTQIPNPKKRYKHIIEEMIYVCELQAKNLFAFHYVFDKPDIYELNTFYGSFLTDEFNEHMKNEWNIEKFDIIVGNPPYQTSKEGNTKTQAIWHYFVDKSFSILTENGYLNMVHPNGWRNIDGVFKGIQNIFKKNNLLYLEMHNAKDGVDVFGASINYDWYVIQNKKYNGLTTIKTQNGEITKRDISNLNFIPNGMFDEILSLIVKEDEDNVEVLHSYSSYETRKQYMSKIRDNEFKYPCVYNIGKKEDVSYMYSNTKNNGHFNIPKLICGGASSGTNFLTDVNGDFGLTQFPFAIVDEPNNLELLKIALKSKSFQKIIENIPNFSQAINHKILSTFRKDFYKQFLND